MDRNSSGGLGGVEAGHKAQNPPVAMPLDLGPFMRQEGRTPFRTAIPAQGAGRGKHRELAMQGSRVAIFRRQPKSHPVTEITLWVTWLIQRIRQPG